MNLDPSLRWRCLVGAALLLASIGAGANELQVKAWAAACANCHGTNGKAVGIASSLAGANAGETMAKLQAFRSGQRPATIMHQISKGYTDAQLTQIAAYFAAQR